MVSHAAARSSSVANFASDNRAAQKAGLVRFLVLVVHAIALKNWVSLNPVLKTLTTANAKIITTGRKISPGNVCLAIVTALGQNHRHVQMKLAHALAAGESSDASATNARINSRK